MAVFNSLTFDGQNSLDYGIYITGEAVYDAPEREVEMINVPGRNGALAIDQGRFQNISVEYKAGTFGVDHSEYASKMRDFRNVLASRFNYKRITDSYHPDEFRLGLFRSGLEAAPTHYSSAGEFSITFDCKPQRYLTSGEEPIDFLPGGGVIDEHTVTGEVVTFEGDFATVITEVESDIEPVQDLHGYSKPWVGGAGKNLLPYFSSGSSGTITMTVRSDGSCVLSGSDTTTRLLGAMDITLPSGTYTLSEGSTSGNVYLQVNNTTTNQVYWESGGTQTFTYNGTDTLKARVWVRGNVTISETIYPMIRLSTAASGYEPYTNICPISGSTEANVYVSPTTSTSDATVYNIDWTADAGTVYGGTLDVTTGVLTVDKIKISQTWGNFTNSTTLTNYVRRRCDFSTGLYKSSAVATSICNVAPYATGYSSDTLHFYIDTTITTTTRAWVYLPKGTSDSTTIEIVYPLATPLTYQLTATQIQALLGQNNVWADSGNVTVKYGTSPYVITNPTPFDAQPLLKVTGKGVLGIGDYIITITGSAGQVIYIDCDSMEIYKNTGGTITPASSLVSFNTNNFPKLPSGVSGISLGTGITEVEIIPRWWII